MSVSVFGRGIGFCGIGRRTSMSEGLWTRNEFESALDGRQPIEIARVYAWPSSIGTLAGLFQVITWNTNQYMPEKQLCQASVS